MTEEQQASPPPGRMSITIDRGVYWFTRHWLAIFNTGLSCLRRPSSVGANSHADGSHQARKADLYHL